MAFSLACHSSSPPLSPLPNCYFTSSASASVATMLPSSKSSSSSIQLSTMDYNSLLRVQTDNGRHNRALILFSRMLSVDTLSPDCFTFPTILKACSHLTAASEGEQIHSLFLKSYFASSTDIFILTSLIHFYACCGRLRDARLVFDQMPDKNVISWNTMLHGYARSGSMESAHKMFYEMPHRTIVSWNTMIGGCVRNGQLWEALKIFLDFQLSGIDADESTLASIISAISGLSHLALGKMAHAYATRHMFSLDCALGVSLIDMYTKSGSIKAAYSVFLTIKLKKVNHWTSMIAAFATHGFAEASLQVFDEMIRSNTLPNDRTFVAVLNACSHGGLVHEGIEQFKLLKTFGIEPSIQHYGCLVDLLGRAGFVEEAMEVVKNMQVEPSSVIWTTLLAACRSYGNAELAKVAAEKLIELDSSNGSSYVLLSNLYANLGRWEDSSTVRKGMEDGAVTKVCGFSWIEIEGQIHVFVSGDKLHFRSREIYTVLDEMRSLFRWMENPD